MAQELANPDEPVVLGEEIDHVRLITLNRPRQLNVISPKVVSMLAGYLEKWENDDEAELVIIKGVGRAFSAGGDLKVFYDGRKLKDSCLEVVYRMYWLCYHIHTYKKTQVMPCRPRSDIFINLPALCKLDNMLLWQEEKWWLPVPRSRPAISLKIHKSS